MTQELGWRPPSLSLSFGHNPDQSYRHISALCLGTLVIPRAKSPAINLTGLLLSPRGGTFVQEGAVILGEGMHSLAFNIDEAEDGPRHRVQHGDDNLRPHASKDGEIARILGDVADH